MQSFERIAFHGKFRDYQQRVLDNAPKYMGDGKLHIVAAPGSGKTVLGLELIRRQGKPCLILSPTTAIREQWGKRFKDLFLTEEDDFDALYSGDLHRVALVNSITYQALYTAMEKVASADAEDTDLSDLDILAEMRAHGIGTVCLDEAHHLKNEWQKALETFVSKLDAGMTVISLTATPPYDAEGGEWERYISVCGEIDEEIFVPELVGQRTLCPHQDYVYFNYPTEEEAAVFETFRENAAEGVELLRDQPCMRILADMLNEERDLEMLFSSAKEYVSLCTLLTHYGYELKPRLIRELTAGRGLPRFSMEHAECAIRFLLEGDILIEEDKAAITAVLRRSSSRYFPAMASMASGVRGLKHTV
jgi:superfamily II DNA or RNA helicase